MSGDESNTRVETYRKWFKDERIRKVLSQDEHTMMRLFNNREVQDILLNDEDIKKDIDGNCVFIQTKDGRMLVHKADLHMYTGNSDV